MPSLTATYTSPTSSSRTFTAELPALSDPLPTADRVAYLAELSSSLKNMQKDVNEFLTQKMADDKAADDANAEETYGEEVVEED
ncbi:EKC KEOPS complex subunit Gon7 [Pyrenophora seminiperda CCB06]|uniref:EKC/KEOPS complex subunit GON7 n=1 Tax=Pyrenophora seminiperda CCB06 TaxID=1302712 RepID=A0A3M7MIB7_9PLEO|nr:EKC KEOPS complex subunit Gon7 [Pyrenophora seminiperda CCB06]